MSKPEVALQHTLYQSRNPTRRYLHCARRDWVRAQIASCAPAALAVELGPGSGVYLPALAAAAPRVVALDLDCAQLRAAREVLADAADYSDIAYLQSDLRALPIADACVDLLLCSEVIEHLQQSCELLGACQKLLTPSGTFILTTPQPLSPLELLGHIAFLPGILQLLRRVYREPIEPTGHINVLGRRQLERQIREAGLCIIARETVGCYVPVIAEFGGHFGQRTLAMLERVMRRTPLRALLWTQCYVLRRANPTP